MKSLIKMSVVALGLGLGATAALADADSATGLGVAVDNVISAELNTQTSPSFLTGGNSNNTVVTEDLFEGVLHGG